MKFIATILAAALAAGSAWANDEDSAKEVRNTDVVGSGTCPVTANKVDPEEKEIYVTMEDGRVLLD